MPHSVSSRVNTVSAPSHDLHRSQSSGEFVEDIFSAGETTKNVVMNSGETFCCSAYSHLPRPSSSAQLERRRNWNEGFENTKKSSCTDVKREDRKDCLGGERETTCEKVIEVEDAGKGREDRREPMGHRGEEEREEEAQSGKRANRRPVRVFIDGCFDFMHFGHMNALRQAKTLGDVLVVGVVADEEIRANKGPPVMTSEERLCMVQSVRWVDETIPDTPYCLTAEFMDRLFVDHKIDFIVHGDDPCLLADGSDAYAHAKGAGKYREVRRTQGISTTDIVGRILRCADSLGLSESSLSLPLPLSSLGRRETRTDQSDCSTSNLLPPPFTSQTSTSTSLLPSPSLALSRPLSPPLSSVVYVDGAFDLFHPGHVKILEFARSLGSTLVLGLWDDCTASYLRGPHFPILRLEERKKCLASCRHVDEIISAAPLRISEELIHSLRISLVVSLPDSEEHYASFNASELREEAADGKSERGEKRRENDRFEVPCSLGILREVRLTEILASEHAFSPSLSSSPHLALCTTRGIVRRVVANVRAYQSRNDMKMKQELHYLSNGRGSSSSLT